LIHYNLENKAAQQADEKRAELARIERRTRDSNPESLGLRETAEAEERRDALLAHLNDDRNIDQYRFAVINERLGANTDIVMQLALAGVVDPTPVGIVNEKLAVPIRLGPDTPLDKLFKNSLAKLMNERKADERRHILPTPALYSESIVGECSAAEQDAVERRTLERRRMELDNRLTMLEAERLQARLNGTPPLLDKEPSAAARLNVSVDEGK
jgi:hypothetical protein